MKAILPLLAVLLLAACSSNKEQTKTVSLDSLMHDFHEENLRLNPFTATLAGDNRYNDILPNSISTDYRNQLKVFYEKYQQQLNGIDKAKLDEDDKLSYDLLKYECEINLEALQFKDNLMPINQMQSLPLIIAQLASGTGPQPFKTVKDYENWLSRLDGFVVWCDTAIANMRKGMKEGYVLPKPLALKIVPQMSSFDYGPVMAFPGQALSYKIGQLKILALRAKAEKELGDKFNIRDFHNQILDSGSLPLSTLEDKISFWIEKMKGL